MDVINWEPVNTVWWSNKRFTKVFEANWMKQNANNVYDKVLTKVKWFHSAYFSFSYTGLTIHSGRTQDDTDILERQNKNEILAGRRRRRLISKNNAGCWIDGWIESDGEEDIKRKDYMIVLYRNYMAYSELFRNENLVTCIFYLCYVIIQLCAREWRGTTSDNATVCFMLLCV